jgi:hypothetical protein
VGIGTAAPSYDLDFAGGSTIRINSGAANSTSMRVGGGNLDVTLLRVDNAAGITDIGSYGFSLKYMGTRLGNDNALSVFSDNSSAMGQIEAVTILQDGKVGIGTDVPAVELHVQGSDTDAIRAYGGSHYASIGANSNAAWIGAGGSPTHGLRLSAGGNGSLSVYASRGVAIGEYPTTDPGADNFTVAGSVGIGSTSPTVELDVVGTGIFSSKVGIGTTPTNALDVNGHLSATSKSFLIDHPTKENKKLQYASLEGPEHAVYVRGTHNGSLIELPEYWSELVHADSLTVVLTPLGKHQNLYVKSKDTNHISVGGVKGSYDYVVYGERKDTDKLEVEPLKV